LINLKPMKHPYETKVVWKNEKIGILKSKGKPDIEVACPPEFGGHEGIWSPEDLFVASVEVCLMTTFLWLANKEKIHINSYVSNARGIVEIVENIPKITTVKVKINARIKSENDRGKIEKIVSKLKQGCLVSNSINTKITIKSEITVD